VRVWVGDAVVEDVPHLRRSGPAESGRHIGKFKTDGRRMLRRYKGREPGAVRRVAHLRRSRICFGFGSPGLTAWANLCRTSGAGETVAH
jgi:hypothetical protein